MKTPPNPNTIRVAIKHEDGHHYMYDPSGYSFNGTEEQRQKWLEEYTIEIDRNLWDAYGMHCKAERFWDQMMLELSNEMWHRREDP